MSSALFSSSGPCASDPEWAPSKGSSVANSSGRRPFTNWLSTNALGLSWTASSNPYEGEAYSAPWSEAAILEVPSLSAGSSEESLAEFFEKRGSAIQMASRSNDSSLVATPTAGQEFISLPSINAVPSIADPSDDIWNPSEAHSLPSLGSLTVGFEWRTKTVECGVIGERPLQMDFVEVDDFSPLVVPAQLEKVKILCPRPFKPNKALLDEWCCDYDDAEYEEWRCGKEEEGCGDEIPGWDPKGDCFYDDF